MVMVILLRQDMVVNMLMCFGNDAKIQRILHECLCFIEFSKRVGEEK